MSWLGSLGVAILTAIVGMFVSGFVATLAIGWYRVSSFEGGSGYFMVAFALLGLVVGGILGLVVSRVVAASAHPGFFKSLGISLGTLLLLIAIVGGTARALADVPPEIDGRTLVLQVELRWPPGKEPRRDDSIERVMTLGSSTSAHVQRASEIGPLWMEDAHQVDGRWVVPAAVRVFTTRGTRSISFDLGDSSAFGFIVPGPSRPSRDQLQWSDWLPHARPGAPPLSPDMFTYRFRVMRAGDAVRTQRFGAFEVETRAQAFNLESWPGKKSVVTAYANFAVRHGGQPLEIDGPIVDGVAVVGRDASALLVHAPSEESSGNCYLLTDENGTVQKQLVGECVHPFDAHPITNDTTFFGSARAASVPRGRVDRTTFAAPGLYFMNGLVLDTRSLAVRRFDTPDDETPIMSVPPLGVSPDERSIVRFGYAQHTDTLPQLVVTDVVANRTYTLPIDPTRMHMQKLEQLDPSWVAHHFEWKREGEGDRLVERASFAPMPYRGTVNLDGDGQGYYWLEPAREGLRDAVIEFLVAEMHGEKLPKGEYQFAQPVLVDGDTVEVSYGDSGYVNVSLPTGTKSKSTIVSRIAQRFDAALATGRYDALFGR